MRDPDSKTSSLSGLRINRYFTEHGIMSRREADLAIADGRVRINGKRAALGDRVQGGDRVSLDGKLVRPPTKTGVIIAYHKPVGVECTSNPKVKNNIIAAVNYPERVFHIGRLDKDSEGLILLTNLGDIVNKVLRSRYEHEKEYIVSTDLALTEAMLSELRKGVRLSDGPTKPCRVKRLGPRVMQMILTEGRNRQIRRMVASLGLEVVRLQRVRIMHIKLGKLPVGKWRELSRPEMQALAHALNPTEAEE